MTTRISDPTRLTNERITALAGVQAITNLHTFQNELAARDWYTTANQLNEWRRVQHQRTRLVKQAAQDAARHAQLAEQLTLAHAATAQQAAATAALRTTLEQKERELEAVRDEVRRVKALRDLEIKARIKRGCT
jgi:chromosome segregation ATPase